MRKLVLSSFLIGAASMLAACSNSPSSPSVSFAAPLASGPANGASYKYKQQPVTLSITNAVRTSPAPTTYTVDVATDASFNSIVFTKANIGEDASGTTAVTISSLPASNGNVTYYWRWKAVVDNASSTYSATQSFVVQQQIIVSAPTLVEPANGSTTSELRPKFTIKNAAHQGATGPISYLFQLSLSSTFGQILTSATVAEQSGGQTSWTPSVDLPGATIYWRVQASDPANTETSPFSGSGSFLLEPFDMKRAVIHNNPQDMGSWPETTKITSVDWDGYIQVDFDKREGPNRWPESSFGGGSSGTVQYTLGMCLKIAGQWHCSAVIQFWYGRELTAGGVPDYVGYDWFYDQRWGIMAGYQPAWGETVGIFVGQGNLRDNTSGDANTYKERSNVLLIPFGQNYRIH